MPDPDDGAPSLATYLEQWQPGPIVTHDHITEAPVLALTAVLDLPDGPTTTLPPLWHWLYFLEWPAQSALGADGHPVSGTFMPPIPRRTRMFAGGRLQQHHALRIGSEATRTSSLVRVDVKNGSSGELAFVTVRSEYADGDRICVVEEQDFVYRCGAPARPKPPTETAPPQRHPTDWHAPLVLDETVLFRFSALTANSHRIHYDSTYATQVEGHEALVVHGPLLVLAMAELARHRSDRQVESIAYRLKRPVYLGHSVEVSGIVTGDTADLTIDTPVAAQHAAATIHFRA